jgi:hypothetical protein
MDPVQYLDCPQDPHGLAWLSPKKASWDIRQASHQQAVQVCRSATEWRGTRGYAPMNSKTAISSRQPNHEGHVAGSKYFLCTTGTAYNLTHKVVLLTQAEHYEYMFWRPGVSTNSYFLRHEERSSDYCPTLASQNIHIYREWLLQKKNFRYSYVSAWHGNN